MAVGVPHAVTVSMEAGPVERRRARMAVQQLLGGDANAQFGSDAILLTAELVSAAIDLTGQCYVNATYDGEHLRVEVAEVSATLAVRRGSPAAGTDGLCLVNRWSSRWGAKITSDRATVWFELDQQRYRSRDYADIRLATR